MSIARFVCLFLAMLLVGPAQAQLPVDTLLTLGDDEAVEVGHLFGQIPGVAPADNDQVFESDVITRDVSVFYASKSLVTGIDGLSKDALIGRHNAVIHTRVDAAAEKKEQAGQHNRQTAWNQSELAHYRAFCVFSVGPYYETTGSNLAHPFSRQS